MRGGASGCRIPRCGGVGVWGAGEQNMDRRGKTRGTEGAERGKTEAKVTMVTAAGRRRQTDDPPVCRKDDGAGGEYHTGGSGREESADESAEWSGEETEE